jgi:L-iditol 2-dehydrogenase
VCPTPERPAWIWNLKLPCEALLLKEYKKLEVIQMPEPAVGPDDVLVRVKACGICGSDVHGYDGSTGRRIPPVVMGHEASGTVFAVGDRITRFRVGDRVTFDSTAIAEGAISVGAGQVNLLRDFSRSRPAD